MIYYINYQSLKEDVEKIINEVLSDYTEAEQNTIHDYIDIEDYINNIVYDINEDMNKYLHSKDHNLTGNFNNIDYDYPYENGFTPYRAYDRECVMEMVLRLDNNLQDERSNEDRDYLTSWFWQTFGTFSLKYNFRNECNDILYMLEMNE